MTTIYSISTIGDIVDNEEVESKPVKVASCLENFLIMLNEDIIDTENNYFFTQNMLDLRNSNGL